MNVVFLISDYVLHNRIVEDYVAARPGDRVSVVKVPLVLKGKGRAETARRIVPRLSRRFLAGKASEFVVLLAVTVLPKLYRRGAVFRRLRRIARRHGLPFLKTGDVMADATLAWIRAREPDVIVSLFHQILQPPLIALARHGVVNVHPGLLPGFKGIQPYFWCLSEGAGRSGATLHRIEDAGIDTGAILARASFPTWPGMSVQLNYHLALKAASALLPRCVAALAEGRLAPRAQEPGGAYWRWPDSAAYDRLASRGHALWRWRDLHAILRGDHDDHEAEEIVHLRAREGGVRGP